MNGHPRGAEATYWNAAQHRTGAAGRGMAREQRLARVAVRAAYDGAAGSEATGRVGVDGWGVEVYRPDMGVVSKAECVRAGDAIGAAIRDDAEFGDALARAGFRRNGMHLGHFLTLLCRLVIERDQAPNTAGADPMAIDTAASAPAASEAASEEAEANVPVVAGATAGTAVGGSRDGEVGERERGGQSAVSAPAGGGAAGASGAAEAVVQAVSTSGASSEVVGRRGEERPERVASAGGGGGGPGLRSAPVGPMPMVTTTVVRIVKPRGVEPREERARGTRL